MTRALLATALLLFALSAWAHKPSDSYLSLQVQGTAMQGQWDIALRDLEHAIGLDGDGDGAITWAELRSRHTALAGYALSRLAVNADGRPCEGRVLEHLVDQHTDGAYAVLRFALDCARAHEPGATAVTADGSSYSGDPGRSVPRTLEVRYALFFDLDPQHRGLLRLENAGTTHSTVFGPDNGVQGFDFGVSAPGRQFLDYGREGVWHTWIGYDHILFLLSLLLPAVLRREAGRWLALPDFPTALWEVLRVVTAFTLAHSLTLSLAALGVIALPSRWVESAIAASVAVAALNNVYPLFRRRGRVAFGFGLIHGLGFAGVLADLGLPRDSLLLALLSFNLGVELGQLAIVAAFLPLAYALRHSWFYRRLVLVPGSLLIAVVALVWLLDRSLGPGLAVQAQFLPDWRTCGISMSSKEASCMAVLKSL
jgi:hypothetical protein